MAHFSGSDKTIIIGKKAPRPGSILKTEHDAHAAEKQGLKVETEKKYDAGRNKQHDLGATASRLDRENEDFKHEKLDLNLSKVLQQARAAKGLTQAELAKLINEKHQIVHDYEQAKGIPNQQILAKMERILGVKLRGKDMGQPIPPKHK